MTAPLARILELTSRQPMTAYELADKMSVSVNDVLATAHEHQWLLEQFAGPTGWLYAPRQIRTSSAREAVKAYCDVGLTKKSPKEVGLH